MTEQTYGRKTLDRMDNWPKHIRSSGHLAETTFDRKLHLGEQTSDRKKYGQ